MLLLIFAAFKLNDAGKANRLIAEHSLEADELLTILSQPRNPMLSAGEFGDQLNLTVSSSAFAERGYAERVARILALVHHHHLEKLLAEAAGNFRGLKT